MLNLIRRLLGRQRSTLPPFDFARNRYKARKEWPPTLSELTEHQQFRFERKFKRRLLLKSIKPKWNKWTKIVQWSLIGFVVVYGTFWHDFANDPMNPRPGEQPFKELRAWMKGYTDMIWTTSTRMEPRRQEPRDARLESDLANEGGGWEKGAGEEEAAAAAAAEQQRAQDRARGFFR